MTSISACKVMNRKREGEEIDRRSACGGCSYACRRKEYAHACGVCGERVRRCSGGMQNAWRRAPLTPVLMPPTLSARSSPHFSSSACVFDAALEYSASAGVGGMRGSSGRRVRGTRGARRDCSGECAGDVGYARCGHEYASIYPLLVRGVHGEYGPVEWRRVWSCARRLTGRINTSL
jgi:hypothetical protein